MSEMERVIFSGMAILNEGNWLRDHAVVTQSGIIQAIIPTEMMLHHFPAKHLHFAADHYLVPGFIDLHIHGAEAADVMDASEEAFVTIAKALAAEGVTGFLATTMTAPRSQIEAVLNLIPKAKQNKDGAAILGVHLEGPFIAKMGAQNSMHQLMPDPALIRSWQLLSGNNIKIVTLAPELTEALAFIQTLKHLNIIAAIGHTDATYMQTCAALSAGASYATHLFNAMRGISQREPGATTALLLAEKIATELIVDGIHLHAAIVELCLRMKGKESLLLVSDAMRAKCLGEGQFELGGQQVHVAQGRATLADGTLAGTILTIPQAIQNMIAFTHCTLADAVQMASENPARILQLETKKGCISKDKDADLVVLDANYNVKLTMREGNVIFKA